MCDKFYVDLKYNYFGGWVFFNLLIVVVRFFLLDCRIRGVFGVV